MRMRAGERRSYAALQPQEPELFVPPWRRSWKPLPNASNEHVGRASGPGRCPDELAWPAGGTSELLTLLLNARDQVVVRRREGREAVTFEPARDAVIVDAGCGQRGQRRASLVNSRVDGASHQAVVLERSDGGRGQSVDRIGPD